MGKMPATRNTQVRGPVAITHARNDPVPESLLLVTSITAPPLPPTEAAPPPCAVGNAGHPEPEQVADDELDGVEGVEGVEAAETVTFAVADMLESA
jgi:hypothetical protein